MFVDKETFTDLEFFRCHSIGKPVFHYLDYCKTQGGRDYLKNLIKNSPRDAHQIIELQAITRFFLEHQADVNLDITQKMVGDFEEYVTSNYIGVDPTLSFNPFLHALFYRYHYPDLFNFIQYGLKQVLSTVSLVEQFIIHLQQKENVPKAVRNIFEEFFRICNEIDVKKIYHRFSNPSFLDVFVTDYLFRTQNKENLKKLLAIISKIDAHLGMAIATEKNGFVFPKIIDDGIRKIQIQGLYHPFLTNPVKNDFHLEEGKNVLFLTGPNMAGKTTYLKSLGISLILAHIGMGVPAQAMAFSPLDHLFFQLSVQDDLRLGVSSFFQEVLQIKRIVQLLKAGFRLMVIVDEIFKGTNVSDAFDCSKIVINGFAKFQNQFFVISSHLYELESTISSNSNIRFRFFESILKDNNLHFTYKLLKGVSNMRIGTKLLEDAGITKFFTNPSSEGM